MWSRQAPTPTQDGQPIRRHEHAHPGDLVHIDIKKLRNIPAGGGRRFLGRAAGGRNRQADRTSGQHNRYRNRLIGHGFIHAAVDDHSGLAYTEIHPDETSQTAAEFLTRAQAWYARGVVTQRVLTDNGSCHRSQLWALAGQQLGIIASGPALSAPDQWQGRAVQPRSGRGLGLSVAVCQRSCPPGRLRTLAALV